MYADIFGCIPIADALLAKGAVAGTDIEVEYITDLQRIMEYGAMSMPALVVNGKIVSGGRVLKPADIKKLIGEL